MATLDSRTAPPSRIESAVERELARRRRLLRLYLLLLLIPLGLAAWFLVMGRSDHEALRQAVDERVAPVEKSFQQVAPKLQQVETLVAQAQPLVEKAADQLQAQEKQVETLRQEVRELKPEVQEIKANQASFVRGMEASGEVKELSARLATVERNQAVYQRISTQLAEQEQRLAAMEKQQRQVVTDLKEVQAKVEKRPGPMPGFNVLDLQKLSERVRALEEGTGDLRKDFTRLQVDIKERRPPG